MATDHSTFAVEVIFPKKLLVNCEEFANLAEARWFACRRVEEHNHERPHSSLGYETPTEFAKNLRGASPP